MSQKLTEDSDGTVGIYDFAKATGHSVKHIYEQIRLGKIKAKQVGPRKAWRIPQSVLDSVLSSKK